MSNVICGEQSIHNISCISTDPVDGKDIETVINVEEILEFRGEIAQNSSDHSDGNSKVDRDESTSGSNSLDLAQVREKDVPTRPARAQDASPTADHFLR
jgi:hypothetical protein